MPPGEATTSFVTRKQHEHRYDAFKAVLFFSSIFLDDTTIGLIKTYFKVFVALA